MSDQEIFKIDQSIDRQENCEGYMTSACCNAQIVYGDICNECQEHTDCECIDCDEIDCPNRNSLN